MTDLSGHTEPPFLDLESVEAGNLSACNEAERCCYEIGYMHGQVFTMDQVEAVVWKRTARRVWDRLWDRTEMFAWRKSS